MEEARVDILLDIRRYKPISLQLPHPLNHYARLLDWWLGWWGCWGGWKLIKKRGRMMMVRIMTMVMRSVGRGEMTTWWGLSSVLWGWWLWQEGGNDIVTIFIWKEICWPYRAWKWCQFFSLFGHCFRQFRGLESQEMKYFLKVYLCGSVGMVLYQPYQPFI